MKKLNLLLIAILGIAGLTSCEVVVEDPCIYASNTILIEERGAAPIEGINLMANVYWIESRESWIEVEAPSNIVPFVRTVVQRGVVDVFIDPNVCLLSTGAIDVYIYSPELEYVEMNSNGYITNLDPVITRNLQVIATGSGDIDLIDVDVRSLDVLAEGSGYVYVDGEFEAKKAEISHYGSGIVDVSWLPIRDAYVRNNGSGDIDVWATDFMQADVHGSGNVYVYGAPDMNYTITGSGGVIMTKSKKTKRVRKAKGAKKAS